MTWNSKRFRPSFGDNLLFTRRWPNLRPTVYPTSDGKAHASDMDFEDLKMLQLGLEDKHARYRDLTRQVARREKAQRRPQPLNTWMTSFKIRPTLLPTSEGKVNEACNCFSWCRDPTPWGTQPVLHTQLSTSQRGNLWTNPGAQLLDYSCFSWCRDPPTPC